MVLIALFMLVGILSYLSVRSALFAFRIVCGLGWAALTIYWHYDLPSGIAQGSPADTAVMLVFGLIALVMIIYSFGDESSKSKQGRNSSSATRTFSIGGRGEPKQKPTNWREGAENYRQRSQEVIEGRRRARKDK